LICQVPLHTQHVHFGTYKDKFISLYCRLSSVLDLDALITQQALREAITDSEVTTAKHRHQLVLDYIQQLDEVRRDLRWITDGLQFARYRQPRRGVPVTCLLDVNTPDGQSGQHKTDSTSSTMDYLPTPSPSPERRRRKAIGDSLLGSDEDGSSEVFLPTDSDYDSSDALSPRELDLLYSPPQALSQQAVHSLGGSAPDVLQIHELRYSVCPPKDVPPSPKDPMSSPSTPPSPRLSALPLGHREGVVNPPAKRKLLSRSHRGQYFSGPQRWLRGHSGDELTGSLSEGVYTKQYDPDPPPPQDTTYVSHASCVLENRKARNQELRPHVRRIFVEPGHNRRDWGENQAAGVSPVVAQVESGGEEPEGASIQEVDSDDQTNAQVSEILSSTL
uniref:Uncharacterized protein n=1 Tax=Mola mola TaxID=94237 RepID=A0A3Q3W6D2_MOLML